MDDYHQEPYKEFVEAECKVEDAVDVYYAGFRAKARMALLESAYEKYHIMLACSYKFFSDMGSSRLFKDGELSDDDEFDIHPHSGNWHFFAGEKSGKFDAFLFLTQQEGTNLFGSPVVLFNAFKPDFSALD
jgi:hypothetical protein